MSPTRRNVLKLAAGATVAGVLPATVEASAGTVPAMPAPGQMLEGQLFLTDYTELCKEPHTAPTPMIMAKMSLCVRENGTTRMCIAKWSDADQAWSIFTWMTVPPAFAAEFFAAIRE